MSASDNQQLIRRWIAFANAGFPGPFDEFIADDYVGHAGGGEMDRAELERLERAFVASFPGIQHSIDELLTVGDRTVMRSTARGAHRGDFYGVAATGRQVEFTAIVIYRLREGRIAESWGEIDFARLFRQLRERQDGDDSGDRSKRLVRRLFDEVFNSRDANAARTVAREILDPQFEAHHPVFPRPIVGPEGVLALIGSFRAAFADLAYTVHEVFTEGDRVCARYSAGGTQTGEFMQVPPSVPPVTVSVTGIDVFRVAEGRLIEAWVCSDMFGLMRQLGAVR